MNSYNNIQNKVKLMQEISSKPMFGYQCYLVSKKFFVGFNSKNDYQIIVRLPKEKQESAVAHDAIKPFSHGAKKGWVEIDSRKISGSSVAIKWIKLAYENASRLAKK